MLQSEYDFKPGAKEQIISEFFTDERCSLFASSTDNSLKENGLVKSDLRLFLESIAAAVASLNHITLADCQKIVDRELAKRPSDSQTSLAGSVLIGDILYLLTKGEGEIYLKRGADCKKIVEKDNCASGKIQKDDFFIFTSQIFSQSVDLESLSVAMAVTGVVDAAEKIEAVESGLFVRFLDRVETDSLIKVKLPLAITGSESLLSQPPRLRRQRFTIALVVILFGILLWSVVFGVKRRSAAQFKKQLVRYQTKISGLLDEARVVAEEDINKSLNLIKQAQKEAEALKKIAGGRKSQDIVDLIDKIMTTEKNLTKKEEKPYEEFYDLTLIEKAAQGIKMAVDRDTAVILNAAAGKLYLLSLSKKSVEAISQTDAKGTGLVGLYNGEIFVYHSTKGIIKIDEEKKSTVVVAADQDWGHINDMAVYSGNLYLLDTAKDEIYKYLVTDEGYSSATSYFKKGQGIDLLDTATIGIDASVYIGNPSMVYKFTAGNRDGFAVQLPDDDKPTFTKVFTDKTVDKVYAWDKAKGKLFVFSKQGEFEKQIASDILAKGVDVIVREKDQANPDFPSGVLVLAASKIYRISLDE